MNSKRTCDELIEMAATIVDSGNVGVQRTAMIIARDHDDRAEFTL